MGRWSRLIAQEFVQGLGASPALSWLDVGCGTGALIDAVLEDAAPSEVAGVDPSAEFVNAVSTRLGGNANLTVAAGDDLPFSDDTFDQVVSGLVLNFVPEPVAAVDEWARVAQSGGSVNAYVWDYAEGMEFLRVFWDAAIEEDPSAHALDEAARFPICQPDQLLEIFDNTALSDVASGSIEVTTEFSGFDDYWAPFTRGQGPAPTYVASLSDASKQRLESNLRSRLPPSLDSTIRLSARAWTISGTA